MTLHDLVTALSDLQPSLFATGATEPSLASNIKRQSSLPEQSSGWGGGVRTRDPGDYFRAPVGPLFRVSLQEGEAPPYLPPARQPSIRTRSSGLSSRASSLATMTEEDGEGNEGQMALPRERPVLGALAGRTDKGLALPPDAGQGQGKEAGTEGNVLASRSEEGAVRGSEVANMAVSKSQNNEEAPSGRREGGNGGGVGGSGREEAGEEPPSPRGGDGVLRLRGGGPTSETGEFSDEEAQPSFAAVSTGNSRRSTPSQHVDDSHGGSSGISSADESGSPRFPSYQSPFASAVGPTDGGAVQSAASSGGEAAPAEGRSSGRGAATPQGQITTAAAVHARPAADEGSGVGRLPMAASVEGTTRDQPSLTNERSLPASEPSAAVGNGPNVHSASSTPRGEAVGHDDDDDWHEADARSSMDGTTGSHMSESTTRGTLPTIPSQ